MAEGNKHNKDLKHCDFQCTPGKNIFCRDALGIQNASALHSKLEGWRAYYDPILKQDLSAYLNETFIPSLPGVWSIATTHRNTEDETRKTAFFMYYRQTLDAWAWKEYYAKDSTISHQYPGLTMYIRQQQYKWERIWARARELSIATMRSVTILQSAHAPSVNWTAPGSPDTSPVVVGKKRKFTIPSDVEDN